MPKRAAKQVNLSDSDFSRVLLTTCHLAYARDKRNKHLITLNNRYNSQLISSFPSPSILSFKLLLVVTKENKQSQAVRGGRIDSVLLCRGNPTTRSDFESQTLHLSHRSLWTSILDLQTPVPPPTCPNGPQDPACAAATHKEF